MLDGRVSNTEETTMTIRQTTLAAEFALASICPAHAEGLKSLQGPVIDLGDVSAVSQRRARPVACSSALRP
jgi:hypothetical protein